MNPERLELTNFRGIFDGSGKRSVVLEIPATDKARLVALVGPNGAGKTTLLDNLHPFRVMPSRASAKGSFNFIDELVIGFDGEKKLWWNHKGSRYLSWFRFKNTTKTKSAEFALYRVLLDGRTDPYVCLDGTASDGKAGTYDKAVEEILGPQRTYFASAFAAQGRVQFSDWEPDQMKALIVSLIDMSGLSSWIDPIANQKRIVERELALAQGAAIGLVPAKAELASLMAAMEVAQKAVVQGESELAIAIRSEILAKERLSALQKSADAAQAVVAKRADLNRQLQMLVQRHETAEQTRAKALQGALTPVDLAIESIDLDLKTMAAREPIVERNLLDAGVLFAQTAAIEAAVRGLSETREALKRASTVLEEKRAALASLDKLSSSLLVTDQQLANLMENGKSLRASYDVLNKSAELCKEVPCAGTDMNGQCKLLSSARQADSESKVVWGKLSKARSDFQALESKLKAARQQLAIDLELTSKAVVEASEAKASAEKAFDGMALLASKADSLKQNQQIIEMLSTEQKSIAERKSVHAQQRAILLGQRDKLQADAKAVTQVEAQALLNERSVLDAKLKELPQPPEPKAISGQELEVRQSSALCARLLEQTTKAKAEVAAKSELISSCSNRIAALEITQATVETLADRVSRLAVLHKAFGPKGIAALLVDDAGPEIAEDTNRLLSASYGNRFWVTFETQKESKGGVLSETFDIRVSDAESGDTASLGKLSGGQRVWINDAISRAIALFHARRSAGFGTLISDETDGALDADAKQHFAAMKSKVLEIGGFGREIFVSHDPSVIGIADVTIDVSQLPTS